MKSSLRVISLLLLVAAAAIAGANSDWDQSVDFSVYKTYTWAEVKTPNQLWDKRVVTAIDGALQSRGWLNREEDGDVSVFALGTTKNQRTLDTFYTGIGGGWGWRRFGATGTATTQLKTYHVGTLIVDLFDAKTKALIWRGTASGTLSDKPDKNQDKLNDAVKDLFKKFPPQPKKK